MTTDRGGTRIAARARLRRFLPIVVLLGLLSPLVAGCLQMETVVHVNKDGSGTVVHRFLMSHDLVAMLAQIAPDGQSFEIFDESQLQRIAENYGETARLLTAEPLETEFGQGYLAVFAFEDVNRLRVDQDPSDKLPDDGGPAAEKEADEPTFVTFTLEGADPAVLLVRLPIEENAEPSDGGGTAEQDPAAAEMMKAFLKDMRYALHVEVAGEILETNATFRDDSRVTLVDITYEDLLSHDGALEAMMKSQQSLARMTAALQDVPGFKMEFQPEVQISFR